METWKSLCRKGREMKDLKIFLDSFDLSERGKCLPIDITVELQIYRKS